MKIHDLKMAMTQTTYCLLDDYDYHSYVKQAIDDFLRDYSDYIEWSEYIPTFRGSYLIKFKG